MHWELIVELRVWLCVSDQGLVRNSLRTTEKGSVHRMGPG